MIAKVEDPKRPIELSGQLSARVEVLARAVNMLIEEHNAMVDIIHGSPRGRESFLQLCTEKDPNVEGDK